MFRANRSLRLRPAGESDLPFLWALFAADEVSYRWVFRGRVPTPEQVRVGLQRTDILANIVETASEGRPIGYVAAFDISDRNGHAQLGAVMIPEHMRTGVGITAGMLFADYIFTVLPLRKLYLHSVAYNVTQFASLLRRGYATEEGILRDYEYFAGRHWDVHLLSISREQFLTMREKTRLHER
ncbi:GNAT family N-acetyltransferase [Yinghuangia sp. YIM S09857]|uniref:GNAT family N-acetyltransferase n=1 Tax=Yinghuangia sp. YIM S09857 TaxID=3436929 RepID=UPI003F536619